MINRITKIMKSHGYLPTKEDEIIFHYGLELLLNAVVSVSVLLCIGTLLGYLKETIIFYLTYLFLKKNTGGYHANSHLGCILQFNLCCLCFFLLYKHHLLPLYRPGIIFLLLVSVFVFAPIEDHNKKVAPKQFTVHKKAARVKTIVLVVLSTCLELFQASYRSLLDFFYLGILMISITVLLGAFKNYQGW